MHAGKKKQECNEILKYLADFAEIWTKRNILVIFSGFSG